MIQPQELRIGSKVLFSEDGTIFTVDSISESGLDVSSEEECTWIEIDQFEPILLSEELLLKCGFENDFHFSFSKGNIRIELDISDKWCFFWNINSDESIFICEVKYLHTIQNITYDLTNEELQINL